MNTEVMRQALKYIEDHPEEWDQSEWAATSVCGTRMCLAGTIAHQAGAKFTYHRPLRDEDDQIYTAHCTYEGKSYGIDELALKLLGLNEYTITPYFSGGIQSLDELKREVAYALGENALP